MIILKSVYFGLLLKRTHNQKLLCVVQKNYQDISEIKCELLAHRLKRSKSLETKLPFQDHRSDTSRKDQGVLASSG